MPGSGALQGEDLETIVRIDDDDFDNQSGPSAVSACAGVIEHEESIVDYIP